MRSNKANSITAIKQRAKSTHSESLCQQNTTHESDRSSPERSPRAHSLEATSQNNTLSDEGIDALGANKPPMPMDPSWSDEMKTMCKLKSLGHNGLHGLGRTRVSSPISVRPTTSKSLNELDLPGRKSAPLPWSKETIGSTQSSPLRAVRRARPMSTGPDMVFGAAPLDKADLSRDKDLNLPQTLNENNRSPLPRSPPSKGTDIEQAILRAKDLTITRLEQEVDILKRQAAKSLQATSAKFREQEDKIRDLKRQVRALRK
jgi:hypothetical protein